MSSSTALEKAFSKYKEESVDLIHTEAFVLGFNAHHNTLVELKTINGKTFKGIFVKPYSPVFDLYMIDEVIALVHAKSLQIVRTIDINPLFHPSRNSQISIKELDISIRCYQTLKSVGILKLSDLLSKPFDEIRSIRGMSSRTLQEIEEIILKYSGK